MHIFEYRTCPECDEVGLSHLADLLGERHRLQEILDSPCFGRVIPMGLVRRADNPLENRTELRHPSEHSANRDYRGLLIAMPQPDLRPEWQINLPAGDQCKPSRQTSSKRAVRGSITQE